MRISSHNAAEAISSSGERELSQCRTYTEPPSYEQEIESTQAILERLDQWAEL